MLDNMILHKKILSLVIIIYLIIYQVIILQYFENQLNYTEPVCASQSDSQLVCSSNESKSLGTTASKETYKGITNQLDKYDCKSNYLVFKQKNLFFQELFFVLQENNRYQDLHYLFNTFLLRSPPSLLS